MSGENNVVQLPLCGVCEHFIATFEDDDCRICHRCMNAILEVYIKTNGPDGESPTIPMLYRIGVAIGGVDVHI